jgi:CubicO group peptidase (beta-lactamase class C family)
MMNESSTTQAHRQPADSIGDVLQAFVDRREVPGAVALNARQGVVNVDVVGLRDVKTAKPMRRDTIFRIASMTKPITAAAAMILVEEGRIALDNAVEWWLPELSDRQVLRTIDARLDDTVPARRPITLNDLLTFRLGLGAIMAPPGQYPVQAAMAALGVAPGPQQLPFGPDEFMARIGRLPLIHQPGERWMYHTGADILAVLIARISGMKLGDFLRERIFAPLGMRDTGFSVAANALNRLTTCYELVDAGTLREWEPARQGADVGPPTFPNALLSTADDYLAFARMLLDEGQGPHGRVLTRESVRLMMTDHITSEQKSASPFFPGFWDHTGWGFGGAVTLQGAGRPGCYGWIGGFGTSVLLDPSTRMTTIVLTQRLMRGPNDTAIHEQVQQLAYQSLDG